VYFFSLGLLLGINLNTIKFYWTLYFFLECFNDMKRCKMKTTRYEIPRKVNTFLCVVCRPSKNSIQLYNMSITVDMKPLTSETNPFNVLNVWCNECVRTIVSRRRKCNQSIIGFCLNNRGNEQCQIIRSIWHKNYTS
jgi:hypothetical protein